MAQTAPRQQEDTGESSSNGRAAGDAAAAAPSPAGNSSGSGDDDALFLACHRLAAATLPAHRLRALLAHAPSPADALGLPGRILSAPPFGLTEKQIGRLADAASAPEPPRLLERARQLGVRVVTFRDPQYPANLLPLDDAPPVLFVRGTLLPEEDKTSLAIVGSRRATHYGRGQADRFARVFAEQGIPVVSGGAAGIDTCAHRGALNAGGRTIAVLGCGIDVAYPAENRRLFEEIVATGGAVVSEFPMETLPEPWRFPTRNRIIAGISSATVVIESPRDSGALITARNAAEYGRDVWAVPGPVDTGRSRGGHELIQDGAALADAPEDVLEALRLFPTGERIPPLTQEPAALRSGNDAGVETKKARRAAAASSPAPAPPAAPPPDLTPEEERLLAQFADSTPRHLDQAAEAAGLSASEAAVAATLLEMKTLIRRQPGSLYVRAV